MNGIVVDILEFHQLKFEEKDEELNEKCVFLASNDS